MRGPHSYWIAFIGVNYLLINFCFHFSKHIIFIVCNIEYYSIEHKPIIANNILKQFSSVFNNT